MKKILSILLVLATILGLCACGSSGGSDGPADTQLKVGYNRQDIMPEGNVPLGGYGQTQTRISQNFVDYLYATCIAFSQGDETVLVFAVDLLGCYGTWASNVRDSISLETGIPKEKILVSASHTHSAPDMTSSDSTISAYIRIVTRQMVKAAKLAIEDLAPATLFGAKTQTDDLNFVREYILEDGRKGTGASFIASGTPVDYMEDNDPEMLLIKAEREENKKDILIMNWQAHPCTTGGMKKYDISADFIASVRDEMEMATGMQFAYFTGAAGNQNTDSEITGEVSKASGNRDVSKEQLGKALANTALEALPNLKPIEGDGVYTNHTMFTLPYNHEDEDKAALARQAVEIWKADGHAAGDKFAVENGFHTIYHANAILSRGSRPANGEIELAAIRVGGVGFAFAPYEMYASSGREIKKNAPDEFTLVLSCSNAGEGYFATMESYDVGTYGSTTSKFARGCAEASSEKLVSMLKEIQ